MSTDSSPSLSYHSSSPSSSPSSSLSLSPVAATACAAFTAAIRGALPLRSLAAEVDGAFRLGAALLFALRAARICCLPVPYLRATFCPVACPALTTLAASLVALSAALAAFSVVLSFQIMPRRLGAFLSPS